MEELRDRLALLDALGAKSVTIGVPVFDAELAFLQFRKILELIAFSSLIANRTLYSATHANFSNHWKAKDMLAAIEKLNPEYYPFPIQPPEVQPNGTKLITPVVDGFLTVEDFVALYDVSSAFLHTKNPFTTKGPVLSTVYAGKEWICRIRKLVTLHMIHPVDGRKWIIEVPANNPVHVFTAERRE